MHLLQGIHLSVFESMQKWCSCTSWIQAAEKRCVWERTVRRGMVAPPCSETAFKPLSSHLVPAKDPMPGHGPYQSRPDPDQLTWLGQVPLRLWPVSPLQICLAIPGLFSRPLFPSPDLLCSSSGAAGLQDCFASAITVLPWVTLGSCSPPLQSSLLLLLPDSIFMCQDKYE